MSIGPPSAWKVTIYNLWSLVPSKQANFDESFGRIVNVSTTKRGLAGGLYLWRTTWNAFSHSKTVRKLYLPAVHKADGLLPRRGKLIFPVLTSAGLSSAQRNDPWKMEGGKGGGRKMGKIGRKEKERKYWAGGNAVSVFWAQK